jgi:hypothetical protein
MGTTLVAMSRQSGRAGSVVGIAIEIGFVPKKGRLPSCGITKEFAWVNEIPIRPFSAARRE